ncbi:nucleotide exchange factor GrpE [soil metagenome]
MNPNQDSQNMEDFSEEIEFDDSSSIDDFIKELEEKEKDLHISSELVIEVEESSFDDTNATEFILAETLSDNKQLPKPAEVNTSAPNSDETNKLKNEISSLQSQISKMEAQRVELFEMSRRRQTDFDNYKNRTERERNETFRKQLGNLAEQMLPVLDNLNRALDSAEHFSGKDLPDFQKFCDGIGLVNQQLNEVLAGMGVQPIASVGEHFDPHFHEAVATEENENFPPHTITAELLRGYRIDDKIIRPAMVKVSKSRESRVESQESN